MKKSFKKAFGNVIFDVALIFATIQIANYIPIPKTALGVLGVISMIILSLFAKYLFVD